MSVEPIERLRSDVRHFSGSISKSDPVGQYA